MGSGDAVACAYADGDGEHVAVLGLDGTLTTPAGEELPVRTFERGSDAVLVPGGSSGGSAAAVAARIAMGSTGTDTGGSIRQPAALCNVVGMKPSYGRVSRYGLIAFASSLDQIGPFAKTVEDAATVLAAISGHDPRDSTSLKLDVPDYNRGIAAYAKAGKKWKLGIPKEYFGEGLDPEVGGAVQAAIDGHAGTFLLDSGAADTLLFGAFADSLDEKPLGHVAFHGVNGGTVGAGLIRIKTLTIGDSTLHDPIVVKSGGKGPGGVDGILGFDVLAQAIVDAVTLARGIDR